MKTILPSSNEQSTPKDTRTYFGSAPCVVVLLTALLWVLPARAQLSYSNVVMGFNPVAYWPLQETTPPPRYDVETNYGSLGSIANAYYASTNAAHGVPGAIAGDNDTAINFFVSAASFAAVPTTDNRVSLAPGQPFSVECWARATGGQSFVAVVNQQGGGNKAGGLNGSTNTSGWSLCQNFAAYRGTGSGNNPPCFGFHVFNGVGFTGGAEVEDANNTGWLTGGATGYINSWVYLCGVFDGTNCLLYMFSTNLDNVNYGGTASMNVQYPITTGPNDVSGGPGADIPGLTFSPDTWDPITFACTRGLNANPYHGSVDEVAIYTNILSYQQITNHFMAGTNGLGNYVATIQADNPYMYWRMDAPKWTPPPLSTYPVAGNYGSAALGMTNFATLGTNAVYQPGTVPGVPGPSSSGFGSLTNACAFNGLVGAVDVGYNKLLDPTDVTNNFTLVAWFKGNPMDFNGNRFNCMASHTDSSWKAQFQGGNTKGYKGAAPQPNIAPTTFNANDGNWHMYVLESTYTNGVSTNVTIYLDSGMFSATASAPSPIPGKSTSDAWIGGAPDAIYIQPTNEASYNASQQYFAGKVAHVAYFTNALTFSQIQTLFYTAEPLPVIITNPVSAAVDLNGAFTNTMLAGGSPPLSYQWYRDGQALPIGGQTNLPFGATNASLIINAVQLSDQSSNYFVVVTNNFGSVTSAVVSLTVVSNLMFLAQSPTTYTNPITLYGGQIVGGTNYLGSTPTFSVSAMGALPISYQWRTNGVAVGWGTGASFTFTNCQLTGPTSFDCVVSNSSGTLDSRVWPVTYLAAPHAPYPQGVLAAQPVGYWRLNEPDDGLNDGNPGAICNDYQSGNNGIYTNVYLGNYLGGTGYSPGSDPTETAAQFGAYIGTGCFAGGVGTNIDFSTPAGNNGEFTVAVWANGNSFTQPGNAGLVTKGYFNGEEFTIDEGAPGSDVRISVRNAAGTAFNANSSISLAADSNWHFIVGVCDEANTNLSLWIDNTLVSSVAIPAASGIFNSAAAPLMIGARSSNPTPPGNNQFKGFLNDAAIFNYALNSNQISGLYPGVAPFFSREPVSSTNVNQGGTLTIPTLPSGSSPLAFQWFSNALSTPIAIPGQTNATLVITNIRAGDTYYLRATNIYGMTNSDQVSVTVNSGAPSIVTDVKSPFYGFLGAAASNSVVVSGTLPFAYQWQFSNTVGWVNLVNNSRMSGAQSNFLTITNLQAGDIGNYQVVVSNSFSSSGATTSSVATLVIPGVLPIVLDNGAGWTQNGSARFSTGVLSLTDPNNGGGTGSYFFQIPQYIGAFAASFTYQAGGNRAADGVTFCLQNDVRGTAAIGGGGGQLGYGGIQPSVALELNIFSGNGVGGVGYSVNDNGSIGPTTAPGSIVLNSGDPIGVMVDYAFGLMTLTFTDAVASASYSTTLEVGDITQILGNSTAYVGFTGSYGGLTSVQTISDFVFVSIPPEAIQIKNATNAVVSWPGSVVGYTLQQNSDLSTTNWLNVTNQTILTNGLNQVTVPKTSSKLFYRLVLPQ